MIRSLRSMLALVLVLVSASSLAAESTSAQARAVTHSCGYYSTQEVEVGLTYFNNNSAEVPWGTSVYLVYGWGGYTSGSTNVPFTWDTTNTVQASATAGYTWGITVTSTIAARSSPKYYDAINFVWKIVRPDGSVLYKKGNTSTYGYYNASFANLQRPCTNGGFIGSPTPLTVTSVVKW
ncbi:MAG TPA: hypothetical protein VE153_11545 [Myxococcus sp.]|nr:hypothetical protein [Myxococcus sp.]